jgi:hypothetical protein
MGYPGAKHLNYLLPIFPLHPTSSADPAVMRLIH